jgi:hypothetical protein
MLVAYLRFHRYAGGNGKTQRVSPGQLKLLDRNARNWLPGKGVLIALAWVDEVDWVTGEVRVRLESEAIRTAPEYDPSDLVDHATKCGCLRMMAMTKT